VRIGSPLRPELAAWRYGDQFGRRWHGVHAGWGLRAPFERERVVCRLPVGNGDVAIVRGRHLAEARILTGGPWGNRWGLLVSYGSGCVVFTDAAAVRVAGLLLARINGGGAPLDDVELAVDILERNGNTDRCFQYAASRPEHERHRLVKLPVGIRLALEMAAHEETERRTIETELGATEERWRAAEEVAAIADDLLIPPGVLARIRGYRGRRSDGA